ncbi:hypothetical protein [Paenibacillus sp. H1-7]|uniref:hypothetical protein n=1 Tax=Paenibacillus sp. H1-7 TaxID=2282849 RepID=UPI001EF77FE0|nr:hypothetical protein [Paenibacillus sp. H1-7]
MNLKTWVICFYLLLIYWISRHIPDIKMIFYPTLGAFSYLFISRSFSLKDFIKLIAGACAASVVSSALYLSHTGMLSFFAATLITIILIRKLQLNAPPVLAIALVPFFAQPDHIWTLPLAVLVSLSGLLLVLSLVELAGAAIATTVLRYVPRQLWKRKDSSVESGN